MFTAEAGPDHLLVFPDFLGRAFADLLAEVYDDDSLAQVEDLHVVLHDEEDGGWKRIIAGTRFREQA
jgi:hypothetical protein